MFVPISAFLSLLFFTSTLPNGIRFVELPAEGESLEIVAGYTAGDLKGFDSTGAARNLTLAAYAAGGKVEFFKELDRTGVRINAPAWSLPMFTDFLPALFKEVPQGIEEPRVAVPDFRARVEEEIRAALLVSGAAADGYATENAFVLVSGTPPAGLRDGLAAVPRRGSRREPETNIDRLAAERTLRYKSDQPAGAIIFASPLPGVYYRQWYLLLLLDRLIHRAVPLSLSTALPLTVHSYYYRLELAVPPGQFPEPVEENLLQELQRLQFTPASAQNLTAARQEVLAYLDSKSVREWYASHDIEVRRAEGIEWIRSMTADDMRVAARDLLIMNRVIASWPPRPKQTSVQVESLADGKAATNSADSAAATNSGSLNSLNAPLTFPPHTHSAVSTPLSERLASGVSLVAGNVHAVFISGGRLTRYEREPDAAIMRTFQTYRADRILVMAPAESMESARRLWSGFKGSDSREIGVPKGNVSTGDLGALLVLKTLVELKLIQAGWWNDAGLRIDASEGSALQIRADAGKRTQILAWIKQIASEKPNDADFALAREVAIHHFNSPSDTVRADLQALTWEHDAQGTVQDLETISPTHVQDVARLYF